MAVRTILSYGPTVCFTHSVGNIIPTVPSTPFEGATPLDRCPEQRLAVALRGDGQRAVTTLLWIDGSPGRGDPRGYTVAGTVRPSPTNNRGRVGREVRIVDEIKL